MKPSGMEKVVVSSFGFIKAKLNFFIAIIHLHVDGHVLELQAEQEFETKEQAFEYLTQNIEAITARLCDAIGLEVTQSQFRTTVNKDLH